MPTGCANCFAADAAAGACRRCGFSTAQALSDARALRPGTLLAGKYLLGRLLSAGAAGITYVAFDQGLERRVALREYMPAGLSSRSPDGSVRASPGAEETFLRGFQRKGALIAQLDHPAILRAYDAFEANATACLVTELLEGWTLAGILSQRGPFSQLEALGLSSFVMDALEQLHSRGLVHGDLHPGAVFVANGGRTLMLDIGEAWQAQAQAQAPAPRHGYAAPELYAGSAEPAGAWTDVYACAALAFTMITGKAPPAAAERKPADAALPLKGAKAVKGVVKALAAGMALNSSDRTQDVQALRRQLAPFFAQKPVAQRRRSRLLAATGFAALVLVGAFSAWYLDSRDHPPPAPASGAPLPGNPAPPESANSVSQRPGHEGHSPGAEEGSPPSNTAAPLPIKPDAQPPSSKAGRPAPHQTDAKSAGGSAAKPAAQDAQAGGKAREVELAPELTIRPGR